MTYPKGKEGFLAGTGLNIRWKGNASDVKLEYTSNSGSSWTEIVGSTPNDSLYEWAAPAIESENFNIRVSDAGDNTVFDTCDDEFTVFTSTIPDSTILRLSLIHI